MRSVISLVVLSCDLVGHTLPNLLLGSISLGLLRCDIKSGSCVEGDRSLSDIFKETASL